MHKYIRTHWWSGIRVKIALKGFAHHSLSQCQSHSWVCNSLLFIIIKKIYTIYTYEFQTRQSTLIMVMKQICCLFGNEGTFTNLAQCMEQKSPMCVQSPRFDHGLCVAPLQHTHTHTLWYISFLWLLL